MRTWSEDVIEKADGFLRDWLSGAVRCDEISFAPPGRLESDSAAQSQVNLYLMHVSKVPADRSGTPPPIQFRLRYLVTTAAQDPEREHQLLGSVIVEALERSDLQISFDAVDAATWSALGTAPRPSIWLDVPLRYERTRPPVPIVELPPRVATHTNRKVHGLVLGPREIPLGDARVELGGGSRPIRTDRRGRFELSVPLLDGPPPEITITAKGRVERHALDLSTQSDADSPWVIRFESRES